MPDNNPIYDFLKANKLTDKDENSFLKEYSDSAKAKELFGFFQANKLTDKDFNSFYDSYLKKKEPSQAVAKIGGVAGTSVLQSASEDKQRLASYLQETKPSIKTEKPAWFSKEYEVPQTDVSGVILPATKPEHSQSKVDKKAYNTLMDVAYSDEDWNDPIKGLAKKTQASPLDEETLLVNDRANRLVEQSLAPDGYEAKRLLADQVYANAGADNLTANMIRGKADRYDRAVSDFRNVDLEGHPQIREDELDNAAIRSYAKLNPHFEAQLKGMNIDINDPRLSYKIGDGLAGSIINQVLNNEDIRAFAEKENPKIVPYLQQQANTLRTKRLEWGESQIGNELSRAIQESGVTNPIANFDTKNRREFFNSLAQDLYKNDPESLKLWNDRKDWIIEHYVDDPSLLERFAGSAKHYFSGWGNTLSFPSVSESIKSQLNKEATTVNAETKGAMRFFSGTGSALGFVASLAAGGEVLGLVKGANASNAISMAGSLWQDARDVANVKYPTNPWLANLSAAINVGYMTALGYKNLLPIQQVKTLFKSAEPELAKVAEGLSNKSITLEAAKQQANNIVKKSLSVLGKGITTNTRISAEMAAAPVIDRVFDTIAGLDKTIIDKYDQNPADVGTNMFIDNAALSLLIGYGGVKARNKMLESHLYEASIAPKRLKSVAEEMALKNPELKLDEIKANIDFVANEAQRLREEGVNERNIPRFLSESVQKKIKAEKLKASPESNANGLLKNSIKRHDEVMDAILKGTDHDKIVTEEERKDAADSNKLYEKGKSAVQKLLDEVDAEGKPVFKGEGRDAAKKDPEAFLRQVADQVFGYERVNDKRIASETAPPDEKVLVDKYTADVVNAAKEMFPDKGDEASVADVKAAMKPKPADQLFPEGNEVPTEQKAEGVEPIAPESGVKVVMPEENTPPNVIPIKPKVNSLSNIGDIQLGNGVKLVINKGRSVKAGDNFVFDENSYDVIDKDGNNIGSVHISDRGDYYQVSNVKLKNERTGLGTEIYKTIIQKLDKPLISDKALSQKAKGLWEKLVKDGLAEKFTDTFELGGKTYTEERYRTIKTAENETIPQTSAENKQGNKPATETGEPIKPTTEVGKETEGQQATEPPVAEPPANEPPTGAVPTDPLERAFSGITHAATAEVRKILGLPEREIRPKVKNTELIEGAKKAIEENPNIVNEIIAKYYAKEKITPEDNAVLAVYKAALDYQLENNPSKEVFDKINDLIKVLEPSGSEAGSLLQSRQLLAAKEDNLSNFMLDKQSAQGYPLSESEIIKQTKEYQDLKKAKEDLEAQLVVEREQHAKDIAELGYNKAKAKAKREAKRSKEDYARERKDIVNKAREALKNIRSGEKGLQSRPPLLTELKALAPHIKDYINNLASDGIDRLDNAINMAYAEFKDMVEGLTTKNVLDIFNGEYNEVKEQTKDDKLANIRMLTKEAKLVKQINDLRKGVQKASTTKAKVISSRIAELEGKLKELRKSDKEIATSDELLLKEHERLQSKIKTLLNEVKEKKYLIPEEPKKHLPFSQKTVILKDRVIELEEKRRHDIAKDEYNRRSKWSKGWDKVMQVLGIRRIVQSALDISIPFRQGATLLGRRTPTWGKSYARMMKTMFSEKKYNRLMYEIRHSELYHDMVEDGVVFNELKGVDRNMRNEDFQRSFIYDIPVISEPLKASNRAADAFLNTARYDLYIKLTDNLKRQGITRESDPKAYKFAANWAMNMTGRGSMIKALENKYARTVLGNTFYGARLMASRFNLLNPVTYFDPRTPIAARKEAMKDMISFVTVLMASGYALQKSGATISMNPWDSDFLQARFGNKVYDISGGLANYVRTFMRMADAAKTRMTGTKHEWRESTGKAAKSLLQFFRNKLSPNTSYATDAFFGKSNGQDFDPADVYRIYPMYADDVVKGFKDDGAVSLLTVLLPNISGIGYGRYGMKDEVDQDIDTLLERNMRSDELDKSKIKNHNDGGREINNKEFKEYIDKRDGYIKQGIEALYKDGANVIRNNDVEKLPYKQLTKDEVAAETSRIKSKATKKAKTELFGEDLEPHPEKEMKRDLDEMDDLENQ